jgi:hypothetical protein
MLSNKKTCSSFKSTRNKRKENYLQITELQTRGVVELGYYVIEGA